MITSFEVLEHLVKPQASLRKILASCESFLFSTVLLPEPFPTFNEWWYFAPEHGQHISFYTLNSLSKLAKSVGKRFVTNGIDLHLITSKRINNRLFRITTRPSVVRLFEYCHRRETLLMSDFEAGRREALQETESAVAKAAE